jgi:enoyl-[acyl-carrier-protein] reductase (NADH)
MPYSRPGTLAADETYAVTAYLLSLYEIIPPNAVLNQRTQRTQRTLRAFARTWLNELKGRNIRVNVLVPGQVATPILEQVFDEETKRQFESLIPRRKMGRPDEIATVALFLASDDSSYVNGAELFVDGGATAI